MKFPLHCLVSFLILVSSISLPAQWVRQYPIEKLEDVLDIDVSSDQFGFAVGTNDVLLRMEPVSREWELLPGFGEGWNFESVDYLDGSEGYIVSAGGEGLIISTDGGNNWEEVAGAPIGIHTLKMISESNVIAISDDDAYKWNGSTWTSLQVPATVSIKGGFILDAMHMWAFTFATDPAIHYTTDGGQTWNTNLDINDIDVVSFYDKLTGIASDGRKIYNTTNGGVNWNLISTNAIHNTSNDITYGTSANVLMAATLNADPALSKDGGVTWTQLTTGLINLRSHSVAAWSDDEFVVGNDLTGMSYTANQGMNWVETSGPTRNLVQDVFFLSRSTGFALGQKGMLLSTTDGGSNWNDISFGTRNYLSMHGLSVHDLWMGSNQRILHSTDTGRTWEEKLITLGGNINDILAISSQKVLAGSSSGIIYLTENGGTDWDTAYNAGAQIKSIARINDQQYMATGFNGVIVRSDDQGKTWHTVSVPEAGLQYEQAYFIDTNGWLVTSSFKKTMWRTTNAGDSWTPIELPIDRFWDGVYFITPDTGVVVSRSTNEGRAYITYTGGQTWTSGYIVDFPLYGVSGVPNPNGTAWIFGYGSDIEVLPYCNAFPSITNLTGNFFPCESDTIAYSIGAENVDNYSWFFPSGWQPVGSTNNDTLFLKAGSNSGFISVSGSNSCGTAGPFNQSAEPSLLPSMFNIVGNLEPCAGDLMTYSAISLEVDTFQWSFPADWVVVGASNEGIVQVYAGQEAGEISIKGSNFCGTDEIVFDAEPFVSPIVDVINNNGTLSLSMNASQYQWFLNGTPIPGANSASFQPQEDGDYYAQIRFSNGCSAVTDSLTFVISATYQASSLELQVYPVPAYDKLYIKGLSGSYEYAISDITGRVLDKGASSESFVSLINLPSGMFIIHLQSQFDQRSAVFIHH